MSSDEERLENMLKAVMETDDATVSDQNEWMSVSDLQDLADGMFDEIPGKVSDTGADDMMVDPLALLDMSEEEIDKVLEKETGGGNAVSEMSGAAKQQDKEPSGMPDMFAASYDRGPAAGGGMPEDLSGDLNLDSESVQSLLGLTPDPEEDTPKEPEKEAEKEPGKEKKKKEKKKREKKAKKEKKPAAEGEKEGVGKRLAALFFGPDEEEPDDEAGGALTEDGEQAADPEKGKNAKAGKKEKKKKEKKKKPPKKNEPDPKKAAKEKQQRAKKAEKAKIKAEKAEKAEKERRAAKKLPKKKVIVWVLFCASIGAGILLLNSIGMDTLHLTEARNAFYDKDFETAYQLLNGRELAEEDQLLFRQSSAVLHLKHAVEAYENHLKMEKPVTALEDLMRGVGKYQEILDAGQESLVTPELTEEYQSILKILQDKYGLSEEGALEINALKDDYEYSLQLEALVNGEIYMSQSEIAQQEEEAAAAYPDLEDILPEEEEYLNDSGN